MVQPVSVLPANAMIYGLNMADNVIYAVTGHECNGAADAVWAVDLMADPLKAAMGSKTVSVKSSALSVSPRTKSRY